MHRLRTLRHRLPKQLSPTQTQTPKTNHRSSGKLCSLGTRTPPQPKSDRIATAQATFGLDKTLPPHTSTFVFFLSLYYLDIEISHTKSASNKRALIINKDNSF